MLSQGLTTLVVNTLTLLAAVCGLFILDWRLGLVALVILPPTLVLTRWFQVHSHSAFLRVRETISAMTAQIAESVSGMAVIQAFNRERAFLDEFDRANDANRRTNTYAQWLNSLFFPGIEFLGIVAMASVLWVGGHMLEQRLADDRHARLGGLPAEPRLPAAAGALRPLRPGAVGGRGDGEDLASSSTTEPEIHDEPGRAPRAAHRRRPAHRPRHLRVRPRPGAARVSTSTCRPAAAWRSSASPAAASRRPRSSSGRFYDPDEGAIRVDGHDLRELELRSYRRQLGVVLQDPFLFAGTIADNIRFARPEATDEQVADVARAVGVDRVAAPLRRGASSTWCARAAPASPQASGS